MHSLCGVLCASILMLSDAFKGQTRTHFERLYIEAAVGAVDGAAAAVADASSNARAKCRFSA